MASIGGGGHLRWGWILLFAIGVSMSAHRLDARAQGAPTTDQTRNLEISTFRPAHSTRGTALTVDDTAVGADRAFALDLWLGYSFRPLELEGQGGLPERPVTSRASAEFAGTYAFADRFEVSLALPMYLQTGDQASLSGIEPAHGASLGDVRLGGKALLWRGAVSVAGHAELTLPTRTDQAFSGAEGASAAAEGIVDRRVGHWRVVANAGVRMRQRAQLGAIEQSHLATAALAGVYSLSPRLSGITELYGALDLGGAGNRALELALGARHRVNREFGLVWGIGRALAGGVGPAKLRLFVALSFSAEPPTWR